MRIRFEASCSTRVLRVTAPCATGRLTEDVWPDDLLQERVEDALEPRPRCTRALQVLRTALTRLFRELRVALVRVLEDLDELVRGDLLDLPKRLGLFGRDQRPCLAVREQLEEGVAPAREELQHARRERPELALGAGVHVEERVRVGLRAVHELDEDVRRRHERDRGGRERRGGRAGRGVGPGLRRARLVEEFDDGLGGGVSTCWGGTTSGWVYAPWCPEWPYSGFLSRARGSSRAARRGWEWSLAEARHRDERKPKRGGLRRIGRTVRVEAQVGRREVLALGWETRGCV